MATPLDLKQLFSLEELLMSQVVQLQAIAKLLVDKGIFTKEELLEMVKVLNNDIMKICQLTEGN
jgi:hypothetical protein